MSVTDKKELRQLEGKGLHIPTPSGAGPDETAKLPPADEIYTGQEYKAASSGREEKPESIGKDITILVLITLAAGLLLGTAYGITKDPIARAQEAERDAGWNRLLLSGRFYDTGVAAGCGGVGKPLSGAQGGDARRPLFSKIPLE